MSVGIHESLCTVYAGRSGTLLSESQLYMRVFRAALRASQSVGMDTDHRCRSAGGQIKRGKGRWGSTRLACARAPDSYMPPLWNEVPTGAIMWMITQHTKCKKPDREAPREIPFAVQ